MLTVLMATWNGAGWIAQCLDSFCALETPEGGYKLVIVDNASTDGTADIVRAYMDRLPVTLLFQPKPGKNRALNLGLEHIEGDLIVFTDDDVIASPDWLAQWRWAADQFPDFDIFGGSIKPYWQKTPPDWLLEIINIAMVYGITGEEHPDGPIRPGLIFGANMMIRASFFAGGRKFDEAIGPDGTSKFAMGGETDFTELPDKQNLRCRFVPQPTVCHIIREGQVDPDWVAVRYFRFGRSMYNDIDAVEDYDGPKLFGVPRYQFRILLNLGIKKALYFISRNKKLFYKHKFLYNQKSGILYGLINRKKSTSAWRRLVLDKIL